MSISIRKINESAGESVQKLSKTYLSGKSTIDEYEIGNTLSRNLVILKKVLGCSEKDILVVDDQSTGKAEKLFSKLYRSPGKKVKLIKLDDDDKAVLYNYNGVLIVVSSPKDTDTISIYYCQKTEDSLLLDNF